MDMTYNYAAGQNNGRITSAVDGMAGETVNYTYDAVNRLASATATNGSWGQAFAYDGFGNLTQKTVTVGSAPTLSVGYDPATNHQVGAGYDGNGNQQVQGGVYNVENRLVQQTLGGLQYNYTYDPKGKRVIQASPIATSTNWTQEIYFYGIGGQKLATVSCPQDSNGVPHCTAPNYNTYFGGKLIVANGVTVATDRLGSVRANGNGEHFSYYPYGEEKTSTADGRDKFGTYFRDALGQDYADQRYYAPGTGRFFTADPSRWNVSLAASSSWNMYSYVKADPANFGDPTGLEGGDSDGEGDYCDEHPADPACFGPSPGQGSKSTPKKVIGSDKNKDKDPYTTFSVPNLPTFSCFSLLKLVM